MRQKIMLIMGMFLTAATLTFAQQNTGTVQGTVLTNDNNPAELVTVHLKGHREIATTDTSGRFTFQHIQPGTYTMEAYLVGYKPTIQSVVVESDKSSTISLQLELSRQQLQDVIVIAGRDKLTTDSSEYVAKMPLKNLENPQVYNVVTKGLMKDQLVTDFQSALQNVAGGAVMQNPDGSVFIMLRGFEAYANIRDGVSIGANNFNNVDPVNLEKIEIIKGPSATLFGSNVISYGGLVNRVTKKPYDAFGGEVSYSGGMWGLSRFTLDLNTPLNASKTALFRLDAASHQEGSFMDAGGRSSWTVDPSFLYKVSDRLTLLLDGEFTYNNQVALIEGGQGLNNISAKNYGAINMPYNSSFTGSDVKNQIGTINIFANAEYKISSNWTSNTIYSSGIENEDQYNMVFLNFLNDSSLQRSIYASRANQFKAVDIQQNFTGKFSTGAVKHRLLLGLDYYSYLVTGPSAYFTYDTVNYTQPGTDNMSLNKINNDIAAYGLSNYTSNQYALAAYGSDVINFTDNLIAMVSARLDHFVSPGAGGYNQTTVSPKLGLIYQVVKNKVSLFGNYMNGFQNQSGADFQGKSFKPQQANQIEGGVKTEFLNGKISSTLTYYNILVKNMLIPDTAHPAFSVENGTQRSQGIEYELIANPIAGLYIMGGYGYNDNRYVTTEASLVGKRPVESPANMVNFWASYKLQSGVLKGLELGFGGNYVSQTYLYFDAANDCPMPAYTILRATIAYDQPKWDVGLRLNNITNQKYWNTNAEAQAPRQVTGTLSFKF